jgi:hypothetical protein
MHTFFINDLIQLYCLRHVSNNQVFILRILISTRLLIWMYVKTTIKLRVQIFLRMNTWLFETCLRQCN